MDPRGEMVAETRGEPGRNRRTQIGREARQEGKPVNFIAQRKEDRGPRRRRTAGLAAVVIVFAAAGVATADTVTASGGNVSVAQGGTGTATFSLSASDSTDPVNGCNADGFHVRINVTSDNSAIVIDAPGYVTVTGCGEVNAQSIGYSVSSTAAAGTVATITADAPDGTSIDANGKTVTRDVCSGQGQSRVCIPTTSYPTYQAGSFTVTVTAPTAVAPTVGYTLGPVSPQSNGWFNTDVSLTWNITGSPTPSVTSGCVDQDITADQAATVSGCTVTNSAGSANGTVTIKRDATAPTVAYTSATGTAGSNGWYTSGVTATFTGSDVLSGFGSAGTPTTTDTVSSSGEGSAVAVSSPAFTDQAGNTAAAGAASHSFQIDLTDPTNVQFVGGPADGSSHYFGSVPAAPTCTANDAISQIASCVVTGHSTTTGVKTLTATATDNAGRTATATRSYTVLAWSIDGFKAPVAADNIVKGGRTVPLKFEIFAGLTEKTALTDVGSFKVYSVACGGAIAQGADLIADSDLTSGKTALRYDTAEGQFVQNWQTSKVTQDTCYRVVLIAADGSSTWADFKATK